MFGNVNLEKALRKERARAKAAPELFVEAAKALLNSDAAHDEHILGTLAQPRKGPAMLPPNGLDTDRIFSVEEIRATCIKYRLRFLDTNYFKGEMPYEALSAIKELQRATDTAVDQFRIMAPATLFELDDCNKDPLLFAPLSNGKYYLIHQWGNDMKWYRKLLALPFRSLDSLVASILIVSALIAGLIPGETLAGSSGLHLGVRFVFFLWAMITMSAVISYVFFTFNHNFSNTEWNSRYFND